MLSIWRAPPTYIWILNNNLVTPSASVTIESTASGSNLTVTNVLTEHLGSYSCTATNSEGTVTSDSVTLEIASKSPKLTFVICYFVNYFSCTAISLFELQPSDTVAVIGLSTIIECIPPLSTPPATIGWLKAFNPITDPRFACILT